MPVDIIFQLLNLMAGTVLQMLVSIKKVETPLLSWICLSVMVSLRRKQKTEAMSLKEIPMWQSSVILK